VLRKLHVALIRIASAMNRPQRDEQLIAAAGVALDRALFPLVVLIDRLGPMSVGDLADRVGRDHTTVSRQAAKLVAMGLVTRMPAERDRRVSELAITPAGRSMNAALDDAREQIAQAVFAKWKQGELETLAELLTKLATDIDPVIDR
jgi:DNA-binding MarR family transcriptional regulator